MPSAQTDDREFDLILYGATGFVGKLLARYVASAAPAGTRIALAGRDAARVEAVRAELPDSAHSWGVVLADAADPDSLRHMAERTRVVVTTVGPYAEFGLSWFWPAPMQAPTTPTSPASRCSSGTASKPLTNAPSRAPPGSCTPADSTPYRLT